MKVYLQSQCFYHAQQAEVTKIRLEPGSRVAARTSLGRAATVPW